MKPLLATTSRILHQLSHDRRTIALALLVPSILIIILRYVFEGAPTVFEKIAPLILGLFPFTLMFIIASISMLRERVAGTLERLMTLPISKFQLIGGYALAFGILATLQAVIASIVLLGFLDVSVVGGALRVIVVAVLAGLLGMGLGLFTSSLASSEFQAVQFLPAFVFPQLLVCGLFSPYEQMARPLQLFADITPLYYLIQAMRTVTSSTAWPGQELAIIVLFLAGAVILASISVRKGNT